MAPPSNHTWGRARYARWPDWPRRPGKIAECRLAIADHRRRRTITSTPFSMAPSTAVLLGVMVTGTIALLTTFMAQWGESQRLRRKEALDALLNVHDGLTVQWSLIGALSANVLKMALSRKFEAPDFPKGDETATRLQYLLVIYAPELVSKYRTILSATPDVTKVWIAMAKETQGNVDLVTMHQVTHQLLEHQEKLKGFQLELAEFARRKYAGDFWFRWRKFLAGDGF